MNKIYAGEICVNDIEVGDMMYECEYGRNVKVQVLTKPIRLQKDLNENYKWEWEAVVLDTNEKIFYLVTEGYEHYGPKLYHNPIYRKLNDDIYILLNMRYTLDLGSLSYVNVKTKEFTDEGVLCEYINSIPGRTGVISYDLFEMNGYKRLEK